MPSPVSLSLGFSTSKTYIFNPQQHTSSASSSSLVTLIPPGTSSSKLQTLMSASSELSNAVEHNHAPRPTSFLTKNRLTLISNAGTSSTSSSSSAASSPPSVTPKLMIQQNSTSNLWTPQSTTKIRKKKNRFVARAKALFDLVSAKMLSHPVQWISSSDHSALSSPTTNDNPIFTTKTLGKTWTERLSLAIGRSLSLSFSQTLATKHSSTCLFFLPRRRRGIRSILFN